MNVRSKNQRFKEGLPVSFMYLHINSDGSVAGCTLDWARKVLVGDKQKHDLYEIWNSKDMQDLDLKCCAVKGIKFHV